MSNAGRFCESCGVPLVSGAHFCESCGQGAGNASSPPKEALACPKCSRSDQSFESAEFCAREITDAEESAANDIGKWGPIYAQIVLEKPERPEPPDGRMGFWLLLPFIPVLNFLACWFAPMAKGAKLCLLGLAIAFGTCVLVPELNRSGACGIVGCLFILFYYAALFLGRGRQKAEFVSRLMPAYEKALARWEHLHYCQRCEVAWIDSEPGKCVDVDKIPEMLNSSL